ncbi:MAG TPA: hypothetical protein VHN77_02105 [Phycisphaerales bacterium]|nr:hypothetical protein [Phycisphaerales bacterium]
MNSLNVVLALIGVGFAGVAGCARQHGHSSPPPGVLAVDMPIIDKVDVRGGKGPPHDGVLMLLRYDRGPSFGALVNDAEISLVPQENASGLELAKGWTYVAGDFGMSADPLVRTYWPIVIRSTMAVGADGTEFIVDCTSPTTPWVHCRAGTSVKIYDLTKQTDVPVVTITPGNSAKLQVTLSGVTLSATQATNTSDAVYQQAVQTALEFELTAIGL